VPALLLLARKEDDVRAGAATARRFTRVGDMTISEMQCDDMQLRRRRSTMGATVLTSPPWAVRTTPTLKSRGRGRHALRSSMGKGARTLPVSATVAVRARG
jgi:hypothetical protein